MIAASCRPLPTPAPSPSRNPARRPSGRKLVWRWQASRHVSSCGRLSRPLQMVPSEGTSVYEGLRAGTRRMTDLRRPSRAGRARTLGPPRCWRARWSPPAARGGRKPSRRTPSPTAAAPVRDSRATGLPGALRAAHCLRPVRAEDVRRRLVVVDVLLVGSRARLQPRRRGRRALCVRHRRSDRNRRRSAAVGRPSSNLHLSSLCSFARKPSPPALAGRRWPVQRWF